MARQDKPSLFDRKLQELERQRDLIQNDIRSLSKSLRKIEEGGDLPPLRSRIAETRAPARAAQPAPQPAAASLPKAVAPEHGPLAPIDPEPAEVLPGSGDERTLEPLVVDTRRVAPLQTPKFAAYLASGSFGNRRPLAQERRIQRNKAVFMVVVVVLALVVVVGFLF